MSKDEALARAEDLGMDLVLVSPDAKPPVCKIINYDKLRYELEKKEKAKKKNQALNQQELKEVKLSYKIDVHDYEVRKRAAMKFLTKGDKVKASIRFKGREIAHRSEAEKTINKFVEDLKSLGTAEKRAGMEGRVLYVSINPLPDVVKAAEALRKQKKSKSVGKKTKEEEEEDEKDAEVEAMLAAQAEDDDSDDEDDMLVDYDIDQLDQAQVSDKIDEVGGRIREMKKEGADKEALNSSVEELLALKARYQEMTGKTWEPAPANA